MAKEKKLKFVFILMSIVLCLFFVAGIVLTFVLKTKQNNVNNLQYQNSLLEQEYNMLKAQHDYKCSRTDEHDIEACMISMGYNSDYWKTEYGYGEDGDKIIEVN